MSECLYIFVKVIATNVDSHCTFSKLVVSYLISKKVHCNLFTELANYNYNNDVCKFIII